MTTDKNKVSDVSTALAKMAGVDVNQITLNDVGPTWGHDISQKAERDKETLQVDFESPFSEITDDDIDRLFSE